VSNQIRILVPVELDLTEGGSINVRLTQIMKFDVKTHVTKNPHVVNALFAERMRMAILEVLRGIGNTGDASKR
jgi:hypothetical protein